MRTFTVSDIHGGYKALIEVFKKVNLDYDNDKVICIGDVCDRLPQVKECFDELLKIKNLIYIRGNHDQWTMDYMMNNSFPDPGASSDVYQALRSIIEDRGDGIKQAWLAQGGEATIKSYEDGIPDSHYNLLKNSLPYYIDEKNRIFVHGGFYHKLDIDIQDIDDLMWNRSMLNTARLCEKDPLFKKDKLTIYEEVYIGHTPTLNFGSEKPLTYLEVTCIDTGAAYGECLTLYNVDTHEYVQSTPTKLLYPESFKL